MQQTAPLEPEKYYHIYTRGNNKETLFREPENYLLFLQLYRKYVAPYAETFAYCLLPNHVHFLVRVKDEKALKPQWLTEDEAKLISIERQLGHLLNAFAKTINNKYSRIGRLLQHRFGRKEVSSESYFTRLVFYIHFNPQHHGLITSFSGWQHSSYHSILSEGKTSLQREEVLTWFGGREAYRKFHEKNAADFESIAPLIQGDVP
ncbi:transposase [Pontibacter rugosus]|uniref:Transposase n=1 Tax=Pontibacter rugosus TaxID=1745966 RepID=A0ABW3SV97_9BACT